MLSQMFRRIAFAAPVRAAQQVARIGTTAALSEARGNEINPLSEGQFKAMILLRKKPEMTKQEFAEWWLQQHAALALQLPKLRKYTINLVDTPEGETAICDGIAELWFDEEKDLGDAYNTEIGKAVAADTLGTVAGRDRLLTREFLFDPTPQE